ncbi:MAG: thioredoxin family protein [Chitinophagales bacterium]
MKNLLLMMMVATISMSNLFAAEPIKQLEIGDKAVNTKQVLKDITGYELQLKTLAKENGLLVIFSCNTCPYVIAWEDRYNDIAAECETNNIGLIVVNSNEAQRNDADSFEEMKKKAKAMNYKFYYALDTNHELADAFGATKTPDVFLFNGDMELVYKGAIDDSKEISGVEEPYLNNAMANMISGEEISPNTTKSIGCSIKRIKPVQN